MKFFISLLVIMSAFLYSAEYDKERAQMLSLSCAGCHGSNGKSVTAKMPIIAGQTKARLTHSLKGFKTGDKASTVMSQHVKGFSDEELEQIAQYLSEQK